MDYFAGLDISMDETHNGKEKRRRSLRGPGQVGRRRRNSAGPLAQAT